jgi:hypothetical protein
MNNDSHSHARQLLAKQRIEGIASDEQIWLSAHLAECETCAAAEAQTVQALAAFRSMNIDLPNNLAARTQLRVRLHAEEMPAHNLGRLLLWLLAGFSWLVGIASAPLVWRAVAWLGEEFSLPKLVWQSGVVLWWLVPGLLAAGVVILQKRGVEREAE